MDDAEFDSLVGVSARRRPVGLIYLPGLSHVELQGEKIRRILPVVHMLHGGSWTVLEVGGVMPRDLIVDPSGNLWVTSDASIFQFSGNGVMLQKFGSYGAQNGEFEEPFGLVLDAQGHLWVADPEVNRIQEFGPVVIPEPATLNLLALGGLGMIGRSVRRRGRVRP